MIAMMLPFGAIFASATTPTYADTTVALVNGAEVAADGLQAAINAAGGGTIVIVKDFSIGSLTFGLNADGTTPNWEIDGNNKTITSTASSIGLSYMLTFNSVSATVKNLTLVTMASGITLKGNANVDIKDCNIYSGDTKPGTNCAVADREQYKGSCSIAINVDVSPDALVTVDGGVYKAYGASGYVLQVKGNAVAYDGYFVGEHSSFVGRTSHSAASTEMDAAITQLSIYGGTWIKPVVNRTAFSTSNGTSDGAVLRADKGSIINIYGGTFANFAGAAKYDGANLGTQRDFVLITGESSNSGFFHIFGGDFYSFMTAEVNASYSQLIGTFAGAVSADNQAFAQLNFFIYGGNFYSNVPDRETNVKAIADKTALNINRVDTSMYTATTTANQTVTVYGKEYTGVTKYAIAYQQPTEAPAGATVKVTHPDNTVYYLKDFSYTGTYSGAPAYKASALAQAVNGAAKDGSTIELLASVSVAQLNILNRKLEVTIDGKNNTLTCTTNGINVCTGDITIKNLNIVSNATGAYALKIAKTAVSDTAVTVDPFRINIEVKDCEFTTADATTAVINNPVIEGTIKMTGIKVNGSAVDDINKTYCLHIWKDTTEIDPADHNTPGIMGTQCTKCGEPGTRPIETVPHDYSTYARFDATQHKKICTCSSEIYTFEDHDWNIGEVTTPATHTTKGTITYTCIDCGETKTDDIAKTDEHVYGDWTKVDDTKHKHTCACDEYEEEDHVWNDGEVTTEATVEAEGVKTYTCTDCGATKTEAIAKLDAPAADAAADEGGCGSAIGVGAVAVLAVAGLACGIVSKKRED